MNGKQVIIAAAVIILGAIGTAAMVGDYSKVPPAAKDLHFRLDGSKTKLLKAVQLAEELTGGIAQKATARVGSVAIQFDVETVTVEKMEKVVVECMVKMCCNKCETNLMKKELMEPGDTFLTIHWKIATQEAMFKK